MQGGPRMQLTDGSIQRTVRCAGSAITTLPPNIWHEPKMSSNFSRKTPAASQSGAIDRTRHPPQRSADTQLKFVTSRSTNAPATIESFFLSSDFGCRVHLIHGTIR